MALSIDLPVEEFLVKQEALEAGDEFGSLGVCCCCCCCGAGGGRCSVFSFFLLRRYHESKVDCFWLRMDFRASICRGHVKRIRMPGAKREHASEMTRVKAVMLHCRTLLYGYPENTP